MPRKFSSINIFLAARYFFPLEFFFCRKKKLQKKVAKKNCKKKLQKKVAKKRQEKSMIFKILIKEKFLDISNNFCKGGIGHDLKRSHGGEASGHCPG